MIKVIIWGIVLYFIFKFIFELIIPVAKVALDMKDKVNKMKDWQDAQTKQNNTNTTQSQHHTPPPRKDDYIDFEEVK